MWLAPAFVAPRVALVAGCILLVASGAARGRPLPARVLLCAALILVGVWRENGDRSRYTASRQALFGTQRVVELELEGRLRGIPEEDGAGKWSLALRTSAPGTVGDRELRVALRVESAGGDHQGLLRELGSGDRIRVWCRLWHPRGFANPGSPAREDLLRSRGIDALGTVKSAALVERLERANGGPSRWIDGAKREARRRLDLAVGRVGETRALLGAILLGDRGRLSPSLLHRLQRAGLQHLVAISGFHVGVLAVLSLALLRRGGLSRWGLLVVALLLFPAFAVGVGGRPSVTRAVVGTLVFLWGRSLGREGDPINTLAVLAGSFVALEPAVLGDAGYQLTFLATTGILYAAPRPASRFHACFLASLAAYLATAPRVASAFGRLAPVAVLSNLPAFPLCAVLLVSGYGTILLQGVPVLGEGCAHICGAVVSALRLVMRLCGSFVLSSFRSPAPSPILTSVYYGLLLYWMSVPTARRSAGIVLGGAFALVALSIHLGPPPRALSSWEATVLDVGQGQAVLLAGAGTGLALVDTAGSFSARFDPGERIVLPLISARGYRRLETLILSHEHRDHAGGARAIIEQVEIGELWLGPDWHRRPVLADLAARAGRRGAALVLAEAGMQRAASGIPLRVLAPERRGEARSANDRSLVVVAGEPPCRLMLPGDVERAGERSLLGRGDELRAEALVVAHHGSRGGTGRAFLGRVRPAHAIVSCGSGNRFGHPHRETVDRLARAGARLWRTDLHGAVRLRSDASGWAVQGTLDLREADGHEDE